jgi:hypothetical protein
VAERRLFDRPEAPHGTHDLLLIAAFAANDLEAADVGRAEALVAGCSECAALAADLRLLTTASAALPAPAQRRRDYRLTPADAERLRPHGLRRVVGVFAGQHVQLARPLATGLTMLGIVGILLSSGPAFLGGGTGAPAGGSSPTQQEAASQPASRASDGFVDVGASHGLTGPVGNMRSDAPGSSLTITGTNPSPDPSAPPAGPEVVGHDGGASGGPSPLLVGSVIVLGAGLTLLVVSTLAVRRQA